ncbi:MAG: dependent oxidoreductase [Phycisphaerales bacterium]|nr:dependent oxidoreductase [Phycisphaerales bacterium]
MDSHDSARYDVIILGGAFSGASAALLLRRECPQLRVLIIEKLEHFDEKVGEATTEMSAMFLTRRLALWDHLEREHLPKEGLRYWFANDKVTGHADATETGGFLRSTVPAFQLRRDVLDQHILNLAVAEGATLLRPARVRDVTIAEYDNKVILDKDGQSIELSCRWLLDATGRLTFLGRRLNLIDWNDQHPTAAAWARWRNVRHLDDLAARSASTGGPGPSVRGNIGSRRLGTNHYVGRGYWIWVIPLGNSETSIGIVYDKRMHALHESKNREADYINFLNAHPALRELLIGAELRSEDLRSLSRLAYVTRQYMAKGWALLGDAAAFIDPYYSPGLDHAAFTVEATVEQIKMDAAGKDLTSSIAVHNELFLRSYRRFFRAAYLDKYTYMGEADLLSAAFLLDTAQYYIFLVIPAYRFFGRFLWMPVLGPKAGLGSYLFMRLYTRRFIALANLRRAMGQEGLRNDRRRIKAFYNLNFAPFHMYARGIKLWLFAEIDGVRLKLKKIFRLRPKSAPAATHPVGWAPPTTPPI